MLLGPTRKTLKQRPDIIKAADCNNHGKACKNAETQKEKKCPEINPKIHIFLLLGL
jgi:hypothetical protein